jgi:hypothetical protein
MSYETDSWPRIQARWYGGKRPRSDWVVIHTMEFPEKDTAAEDIARDFANRPPDNKASAHVCADDNSVVQCVLDSFEAYGAGPTANARGLHVEHAGYMGQSRDEWRDPRSVAILAVGADVVAQYCLKFNIPAIHLTDEQLRKGVRGIVGHEQVSRVFKESDHSDPGPNFPWDRYMFYVKAAILNRQPTEGS